MAFLLKTYSVGGKSYSGALPTGATTHTTAWSNITIPVPSGSPFYVMPDGFTTTVEVISDSVSAYSLEGLAYLQFADSGSSTIFSVYVGLMKPTSYFTNTNVVFENPFSFGTAIAKYRLAVVWTGSRPGSGNYTYDFSVSGGTLRIYETAAGGGVGGEAVKDSGMARPALVTAGGSGRTMTKMRYRLTQSVDDAGEWSGTPVGDKLRRFT